jgi:hypothetical protein
MKNADRWGEERGAEAKLNLRCVFSTGIGYTMRANFRHRISMGFAFYAGIDFMLGRMCRYLQVLFEQDDRITSNIFNQTGKVS